ncbi:MAG TPA: class I SAM-dependent methyltransferase [Terracidiphilus sp.]
MSETANFDKLAGSYRWLEAFTFGPALQHCRLTYLARMANARRALVLGDGDGRFTAALLRASPNITLDAIDSSAAMLAALQRRAGKNANRVRTTQADARTWQPGPEKTSQEKYDLIATHFFLDCLSSDEAAALAAKLHSAAAPGALWAISEFHIPDTRFGRVIAAPLVAALYRAFGLLTGLTTRRLPAYHGPIQAAGFRLAARRERLRGLLAAELWHAPDAKPLP